MIAAVDHKRRIVESPKIKNHNKTDLEKVVKFKDNMILFSRPQSLEVEKRRFVKYRS